MEQALTPREVEEKEFDQIYAFATWTDKELVEGLYQIDDMLAVTTSEEMIKELDVQAEHIWLEISYRNATEHE